MTEYGDTNINTKDENVNTALMYTASSGRIKTVKILLVREEDDINVKNKNGYTACKIAETNNQKEICSILL